MDKQDNSRETAIVTAIDNAIKYGLVAVGIVAVIGFAVALTGTPVKEPFKLHANIPIAQ